jgi:hypothetical protein
VAAEDGAAALTQGHDTLLQLHELLMRVADEVLDHVLLAQPVAAGHGVVEVVLQRLRMR